MSPPSTLAVFRPTPAYGILRKSLGSNNVVTLEYKVGGGWWSFIESYTRKRFESYVFLNLLCSPFEKTPVDLCQPLVRKQ
jgi:hypothetical protein